TREPPSHPKGAPTAARRFDVRARDVIDVPAIVRNKAVAVGAAQWLDDLPGRNTCPRSPATSHRVGEGGLEPPHPFGHRNLNPVAGVSACLAESGFRALTRRFALLGRVRVRLVPVLSFGVR